MIREENVNIKGIWCKYSKYEIKERDGLFYIVPTKDSVPSTYDVFEVKNDILKDILFLGMKLWDDESNNIQDEKVKEVLISKNKLMQELVLDFVSKYGFLGNFQYLPESMDFLDDYELGVKLNYHKEENTIDFEKHYFGFYSKLNYEEPRRFLDFNVLSGFNDKFEQTEGDRLNSIIFSKYYSESVYEILKFASKLYDQKYLISLFQKAETKEEKDNYRNYTEFSVRHSSLSMKLDENDSFSLNFGFDSLASILENIFVLNESNNRTEVRLCRYCNKPFIANNLNSFYDRPQCRNNAGIKSYRERQKEENNLKK